MRPLFPGMDPWLENPELWPDVHNSLITAIRDAISPQVVPRYFVGVETRTTILSGLEMESVYEPDVTIHQVLPGAGTNGTTASAILEHTGVRSIEVAVPVEDIEETYLTVKEMPGRKLVTVIEVLSPTNKKTRTGRAEYLDKRAELIRSRINFVEIDLLRDGDPMPLVPSAPVDDYRILVNRSLPRRKAILQVFPWTVPIPPVPIPLLPGRLEPMLELNSVLHGLMDRARYDLVIDYGNPPRPPLSEADAAWAASIIASTRSDGPRPAPAAKPGPELDPNAERSISREAQT